MPESGVPSLYIHWPYCQRKCPYCDFNVHLSKQSIDETLWVEALLADLSWQRDNTQFAPLQTLYLGGGTPSLLSPRAIERLITGILRLWPQADNLQTTLEVHPTSADQAKFADFHTAGINRVSIGVQSFDDTSLKFLGRDHNGQEAQAAVATARRLFNQVNLDLMTALPNMTLSDQTNQIDRALALGVDHLSVYQLGIEPGTAFGQAVARGDWIPPDPEQSADLFLAAIQQIRAAGFIHYEVSNFAKPGCESRHSVLGWQGYGYIGLGPGAEGRALDHNSIWRRRLTVKNPRTFLQHVRDQGHGLTNNDPLSPEDRAVERLIFGLRLTQGLPLDSLAWSITKPSLIQDLIGNGDLIKSPTHCAATSQGRLRLDAISNYLINYA